MNLQMSDQDRLVREWFGKSEVVYDIDFLKRLEKMKLIFRLLPFVKNIGVCNSIALGMADEKSDIDLFVVTRANRLYITRVFLVVLFQLLGVRRHGDKVSGRFCLSFMVDEESLNMANLMIKDDYYLELWRRNIWWIYKDDEIFEKWVDVNELRFAQSIYDWDKFKIIQVLEKVCDNFLVDKLESFLGRLQRLYAHKKYVQKKFPKGVIFEEGVVKCHDMDARWDIRKFVKENL